MSEVKYDNHKKEWTDALNDKKKSKIGDSWMNLDTLDSWRHNRMRRFLKPFIDDNAKSSWLTIGDGRYGGDANYLIRNGAKNVHASDISDILLKIANKNSFIKRFSEQNAEKLTFKNDSFEFVLCKDSLHHFPRPYIAMNEMLRVSRQAVIFIEPRDHKIDKSWLANFYSFIRFCIRLPNNEHGFETVGNYVYTFSEREIEKFFLGMHLTDVAFAGIDDAYYEGIEFVNLNSKSLPDKLLTIKLRTKIIILTALTVLGFKKSGTIITALFKKRPSTNLQNKLKRMGWNIKILPSNPYI